jgi:hypothetical protein
MRPIATFAPTELLLQLDNDELHSSLLRSRPHNCVQSSGLAEKSNSFSVCLLCTIFSQRYKNTFIESSICRAFYRPQLGTNTGRKFNSSVTGVWAGIPSYLCAVLNLFMF